MSNIFLYMSPISNAGKSLRERKEVKTRQTILDTAEDLFNSFGISQVSVQDIADQAMLSRATLYNYYGSKDGIMYGLVSQRLKEGNERLKQLVVAPLDPYEKLKKFIEVSLDASLASPSRYAILRRFLKMDNAREVSLEKEYEHYFNDENNSFTDLPEIDLETTYQLKYLEEIWRYERSLVQIIQEGQEKDVIIDSKRPMELAYFFIMTVNGLADQLSLHSTPLSKYNIQTQAIRELFLTIIEKVVKK